MMMIEHFGLILALACTAQFVMGAACLPCLMQPLLCQSSLSTVVAPIPILLRIVPKMSLKRLVSICCCWKASKSAVLLVIDS